jgi:transposase
MDHLESCTFTPAKGIEARKFMISPETIRKVRLDHQKNISQRKIAKKRGIDRKTVKAILDNEKLSQSYSDRKNQEYPKLKGFKDKLEEMLLVEKELPRKERSKLTRLFERLIELGYRGGYDSIRRYSRFWQKNNNDTSHETGCIPMEFSPGEAFQFDWTPEYAVINGERISIKVGVMTLCHSRMPFSKTYPTETTEMLLDFHVKAFSFFGGSCERGIYDNMKTAVKKVLSGKEREWQKKFELLGSHYLFENNACTPGEPQEKGQVERRVQTVQEDFFRPTPKFDTLDELNEKLEDDCIKRSRMRIHPDIKDKTVSEVFLEEKKSLIIVNNNFDAYVEKQCCVSKTQLIQYDKNKYSVPSPKPKVIEARVYADKLIFIDKGKVIARHARCFGKNKVITNFEHYLNALDRKPGAIRNGIPFQDENLPSAIEDLRHKMKERFDDADRQFVDILCAVREFGVDSVSAACELAMENSVVSKDVVLNILYRTKIDMLVDEIIEPDHLKLNNPPSGDCSHYDNLLTGV